MTTPKVGVRLLHDRDEAADLLSVSERTLDRLIADGLIEAVNIGRRRLVPHASLEAYIENLRRSA